MNCVKHHMRRTDTTIRCFTCIELGHLGKSCMNTSIVKDEKNEKNRHWIQKNRLWNIYLVGTIILGVDVITVENLDRLE